jgi:hypothetical protein
VCCFTPFGIAIPTISSMIGTTGPSFGSFTRIIVSAGLFTLVVGVTCFSVFVHLILNKIELEKQKKFVLNTKLIPYLNDNSVDGDIPTLAHLYEEWRKIHGNSKKFLRSLLKGDPVSWWDDEDKTSPYAKTIVTSKRFKQL